MIVQKGILATLLLSSIIPAQSFAVSVCTDVTISSTSDAFDCNGMVFSSDIGTYTLELVGTGGTGTRAIITPLNSGTNSLEFSFSHTFFSSLLLPGSPAYVLGIDGVFLSTDDFGDPIPGQKITATALGVNVSHKSDDGNSFIGGRFFLGDFSQLLGVTVDISDLVDSGQGGLALHVSLFETTVTPEPSTLLLLAAGFAVLAFWGKRKSLLSTMGNP